MCYKFYSENSDETAVNLAVHSLPNRIKIKETTPKNAIYRAFIGTIRLTTANNSRAIISAPRATAIVTATSD